MSKDQNLPVTQFERGYAAALLDVHDMTLHNMHLHRRVRGFGAMLREAQWKLMHEMSHDLMQAAKKKNVPVWEPKHD